MTPVAVARKVGKSDYAIIKDSETLRLPFFSTVNLRQNFQNLSGLGYRVSLAHVKEVEREVGAR